MYLYMHLHVLSVFCTGEVKGSCFGLLLGHPEASSDCLQSLQLIEYYGIFMQDKIASLPSTSFPFNVYHSSYLAVLWLTI